MSRLLITAVSPIVEFKEDAIERKLSDREYFSEKINQRFEGIITLQFVSSGDLTGWTKQQIATRICEALLTDHISL